MQTGAEYEYDVCLSFAGEEREYVEAVAKTLKRHGVTVFYDRYEQVELWGKDLYQHLDHVFRHAAAYCVAFISEAYVAKVWAKLELASAQARDLYEQNEYLLPARFDNTELPGLRPTIGYIDLRRLPPAGLAELIVEKVRRTPRSNVFPDYPNAVFVALSPQPDHPRRGPHVLAQVKGFYEAVRRMSEQERRVVFSLFLAGCQGELPENVHISADVLRRLTGFSVDELKSLLGGLQSLGFFVRYRPEGSGHDPGDHASAKPSLLKDTLAEAAEVRGDFALEWHLMSLNELGGNATLTAAIVVELAGGPSFTEHGLATLLRLDFSALAE